MRLFIILLITIGLASCSNSDSSNESKDKETSSQEKTEPEMDFCDCGLLAIEKAKLIDSDPDELEQYEEEFRPCKELFDAIPIEERMRQLMNCPEVMEQSKDLMNHIDAGGFLEKAREKSEDVDLELKELEEKGMDTLN